MSRAATAEPPPRNTQTAAKVAPLRREILTRDPEIHARAGLDEATVKHYAELMREGTEFPALTVFDDGDKLWLADGFLRDAAAERAGLQVFPCEVKKGSRRDALLFSIKANARHGLKLSSKAKRRAVEQLLSDEEWSRWNDSEIARLAGVSHPLVTRMRQELRPESAGGKRLIRRGGQVYAARPTNRSTAPPAPATPPAPSKPLTQPGAPSDYIANWLLYLPQMSPQQLFRWKNIIKSRVSLTVLAEAVDIIMREGAQAGGAQ